MHVLLSCSRFGRTTLLAVLFCALAALHAADLPPKLPPGAVLLDGKPVNPGRVLVRWKDPAGAAAQALRVEQTAPPGARVMLGAQNPNVTTHTFVNLPGIGVVEFNDVVATQAALASGATSPANAATSVAQAISALELKNRIRALEDSGLFAYVEPDYIQYATATPGDGAFGDGRLWGLRNTGQNGGVSGIDAQVVSAWDLTTGSTNVIVAVIDTGIRYTHRDLATNMWRNPGEIAGNGADDDGNGIVDDVFGFNAITRTGNPLDDNGHGSHCAGTIGGSANDAGELVGVAWTVRLMGLKFLGADGGGNLSDAIRCIDYAIAKGAHIISGSYGGGGYSQATADAISRARQAGILCVFAAGNETNDNDANPAYPASYPHDNIISVAAIDRTGALANFSNHGATSVDLAAPGVQIFSCNFQNDSAYQTISGTSMATPHVAGVAALLKARFPNEDYVALRERLLATTRPIPGLQGRVATGGIVQARAAMDLSADGVIEVSVSVSPSPLRTGEPATIALRVSDRSPLAGATVTGTLGSTSLVFLDNGAGADARANDGTYTVRTTVPAAGGDSLTLSVNVTASGKTPFSGNTTLPVISPPTNDAFASAATLNLAALPVRTSNVDASIETGEPAHAGTSGGRSLWWNWTAPSAGQMQLTTAGSSFDTVLAVYTGANVSALTAVTSNDDSDDTLQSAVSFNAAAGVTYRIAIDGFRAASGDVVLSATFSGSGGGNTAPSFVRQPPAAVRVQQGETIRIGAEVAGSPTPALRWSFNGADLNNGGRIDGATTAELVITNATATDGGQYRLTASNSAGSETSIVVTVTVDVALVRPPNDGFAERLVLIGEAVQAVGTNTGATAEAGEPAHAGVSAHRSIWWTWTAPQNGTTSVDTFGSAFDTVLAVYRGGAVNALTPVASNDDAPNSRQSRLTFDAESGVAYAIAVESYSDASGAVTLRVAQGDAEGLPPAIAQQPLDLRMQVGFEGALAIRATGAEPLSFQWWKNGAPVPGATSPVLWFRSAQLADAGDYHVVVSNPWGSATSDTVQVTVESATAPNDNFAARAIIAFGGEVIVARLNGATRENGEPPHAGGSGGTLWWSWRPLVSGSATISTEGSLADSGDDLDTVLAVYTGGSLGGLSLVASNDDFGENLSSSVTFTANAGTTYQIAVGGYDVSDLGIVILTTPLASDSVPGSAPGILLDPATYVASEGEDVVFIVGVAGSPNPSIQWQRSSDGGATWGDLVDSDTISGANSLVLDVFGVNEGQNGRLVRAVVSNALGSATSNVAQLVVLPRPVNDNFAAASAVPAGTSLITGDNFGATTESGEPAHAAAGAASVWWTWQAPFSGTVEIDTTGSDFDTVLAVYTGTSVGSLTEIASNDDFGDARQSLVSFDAVAGTTYRIAVSGFDGAQGAIVLTLPADVAPGFARQPTAGIRVTAGGLVTISAGVTGSPTPALQWQRSLDGGTTWEDVANDATFSGATTDTLRITGATESLQGQRFRLVATNTYGTVTSGVAALSVTNPQVKVVNLSTRAVSQSGDRVIIAGFYIGGSGTKRVLLRAVGPRLSALGVNQFLPNPRFSVFRSGVNELIAENDDWVTQAANRPDPAEVAQDVFAFPLTNDSLSAAVVLDLPAGGYSVVAQDVQARSGVAVVEMYDADDAGSSSARLINVSSRCFVGVGEQVMIPGFYVNGTGARRYLVRAVGPRLANLGVGGVLADPQLSVRRVSNQQVTVASNDNWVVQTDPNAGSVSDVIAITEQVHAFSLGNAVSGDTTSAAMIVWLEPGGYTVVVSGKDGGTGIALAEIYEVP